MPRLDGLDNSSIPIMKTQHLLPLVALMAAALSGCGGGGGDAGEPTVGALGTLRMALTDAPACGFDKMYVTVQRVRVHRSSTADDAGAGWEEIVLASPKRVDLLSLQNGALTELGQTALPAGTYQQLRLVLEPNTAANPLANSIQPTGGSEIALETPSAMQSGLKLNVNLQVAANQIADFAIDFEACKSVVKAGNSGRYILKPVLSVIPLIGDAGQRIVGFVDNALANGGATVSAQANGQIVRATPTDATGKFVLYPVPAGNYELVVNASGRANVVVTGVPVTTTAFTNVGSDTVRLVPPVAASAPATVSGVVTVNGATANTGASVRALQTLSGGPTLEMGFAAASATDGSYSLTLPLDAPARWAYQANATSISFTSVAADAGKYKFEANAPGLAPKLSAEQTLTGNSTLNISLP